MRYVREISLVLAVIVFSALTGSGESVNYESRGTRDPFIPLIGINKPVVSRLEEITSIADVKLEGIASKSDGKMMAILNGQLVKDGDRFGDIEIRKITKDTVTIFMGGNNYNKSLAEEGGKKSGL